MITSCQKDKIISDDDNSLQTSGQVELRSYNQEDCGFNDSFCEKRSLIAVADPSEPCEWPCFIGDGGDGSFFVKILPVKIFDGTTAVYLDDGTDKYFLIDSEHPGFDGKTIERTIPNEIRALLSLDYRDLTESNKLLEDIQSSNSLTLITLSTGEYRINTDGGGTVSALVKFCDYYRTSDVELFIDVFFDESTDASHIRGFIEDAFEDAENDPDCSISGYTGLGYSQCRYNCIDPRCVVDYLLDINAGLSDFQKRVLVSRYLEETLGLTDDEQNWLTLNDQSDLVYEIYNGLLTNQNLGRCEKEDCGLAGGYHELIKQKMAGESLTADETEGLLEFFSVMRCDEPELFNCVRNMQKDEENENGLFYFTEIVACSPNLEYNLLINEVHSLCGCPVGGSSELENFDSGDVALEDESKWGQLGDCNDIVSELGNVDLSGTLEQQIDNIVNHFNCNVKYTRPNSGPNANCLVYDSSAPDFCTVKKYLYTEDRGWLNMLHVFTIFQWAQEIYETGSNGSIAGILESAVIAEMEGYSAEAWQWAKDNFSAFSYEDLCSNHVGAMMFVSFYEDLSDGNKTWTDAVNELCTAFNAKDPSAAPNYDYIPYLIDGKYPKIFNPGTCLTGAELEGAGEANFCNMTLEQQLKLLEAHGIFPH